MDYFTILNLDREPFSNSPDPDFFFQSRQHVDCLQKLELALRLKRGLNIVIGAVGAGKTTLCRTLLKKFSSDRSIESHLILDPAFISPVAFLESICAMVVGNEISGSDAHQYKEQIKHHLLQKGVDENKTVILIIDEGQKLPVFCLEILRELLNYETNDHKLLQIVLFAQEEFQETLDRHANLADRVNLIHVLGPMSFTDTSEMIQFRVKRACSQPRPPQLFTWLALRAIYHATGGYPRKIINLCHQCMLALIVQNRSRVGWRLVRSCTDRSLAQRRRPRRYGWSLVLLALAFFVTMAAVYLVVPGWLPSRSFSAGDDRLPAMPEKKQPLPNKAVSPLPPETPAPVKQQIPAALPAVPILTGDERRDPNRNMAPSASSPEVAALSETSVKTDPMGEIVAPDPLLEKVDVIKPSPPSLLGALTVRKNDTLGLMVKIIYGDFNNRYLNAVLDANPHIGHADAIRVGDTIAFPGVGMPFHQGPYPLWWINVAKADSLETAFRSVKASGKDKAPLMRMISTWSPQTGLEYGIYVSGYFFSLSAAETMMANLPAELSASAEILSGWPTETLLFTDPVLGKGY
jgi:general secretion pathway protein A